MEQEAELTFKALNERIDAIPDHPSVSLDLPTRARYGYAVAFLAFSLCLLAGKALPGDRLYTLIITILMLVIELVAIGLAVFYDLSLRMPGFRSERKDYAEQLDHDLQHHENLIVWVAGFPRERIALLSDYADLRNERFKEKQSLLTGGLDKLGMLPIVIAIYLQARTLHWPLEMSPLEIGFCCFLALIYWVCLISVNARLRGQLYGSILKRALTVVDKRSEAAKENEPSLLTSSNDQVRLSSASAIR
jgi:hypothetical protein